MKTIVYRITCLLFVLCYSCNNAPKEMHENDTTKNVKKESKVSNSRVVVTLNGMDYSTSVNCVYFEHEYFYFKSDKLETTDTNGDGLVITGHQKDDKMVLTLIVDDKKYSTANLGIQKRDNQALGAGKLFLEGSVESFNATYKVTCN